MTNLSLRGLDDSTLSRIRSVARRRKLSVNRLIVETLREQYAPRETEYRDLDPLMGVWSKEEATAFGTAVAPFGEIDPALWVEQPRAPDRVKRTRKPRARR